MDDRDLDREIAGCAAAHQRLLTDLDALTDEQAQQPSLVPGRSAADVLVDLTRDADRLTAMFHAAEHGEAAAHPAPVAVPASEARMRPAETLVRELRWSIWRLESTWAQAAPHAWAGTGRDAGTLIPIRSLPMRRWREVVVRHVDLGLGYTPDQWPAEFVRIELRRATMLWSSRRPMGMTDLPPAANALEPTTRLLWLLGRIEIPDLDPARLG